jgi:N-acetyl sugar amidotransferase
MPFVGQICKKGVWDESIPGITFDEDGISNYYRIQESLTNDFPRGEKGEKDWKKIIEKVKASGKKKRYDCIIGVSGGVDSSYLLHLCKEVYGLRPLAVNLDNGWSSDIAVKNIRKVTSKLDIDLETYVIDYEEIKDILRSYMRASLPWIDIPTDIAIKATMYNIARENNIKYVFRGNDFRSEGKQPREWTYSDSRQLKYIQKKFGDQKNIKTFPNLTFLNLIYSGFIRGIKDIRPFYFLSYQKQNAKEFLIKEYGWEDYGGHHFENIFTKFAMSIWLPEKFGIDKRKITLSAQVVSGALSREKAIEEIKSGVLNEQERQELIDYVLKKLSISQDEYNEMMNSENKFYYDYPSDMPLVKRINKYFLPLIQLVYPIKPMAFYELEARKNK